MRLGVRASDIKDWFQYRCERRLLYATLEREFLDPITIVQVNAASIRSEEGQRFEEDVVRRLRASGASVLGPRPGHSHVHPEQTAKFLRGESSAQFLYQPQFDSTPQLRDDLHMLEHVSIRSGRPDLLEWVEDGEQARLRIIDIKHTRRPTQYHRAQVAFYSLMLRGILQVLGLDPSGLHRQANIWFIGPDEQRLWEEERGLFDLHSYEELVRDFFRRQLKPISKAKFGEGRDESFFHLYFKCEQCKWLAHCEQTIADVRPRRDWDVSAIPGLSHQSKAALHGQGLRTLGAVAEAGHLGDSTWVLRTRGRLLEARAAALLSGEWARLPEHHTWLMPPQIDVPIFLVVDRDPVADHLATIACLVGGVRACPAVIEVVTRPEDELPAIVRVLRGLIETLKDVHDHNQSRGDEGLRAHIFVYEASEANDLRDTLSAHLDDPEIRNSLIHLVRIFPPEEIRAPEPEYRGAHHLPASALRSVMEQLYVLPAKVSYDLARVSVALMEATPPISAPYRPQPGFGRPFSARLSIDVMRRLADEPKLVDATRRDVLARLEAMRALCDWILADNANSNVDFLRLRKPPFRFQAQFEPLDAIDLDVLLAQELLQSRADRLATLVELARPADERRERLRCYAGLELLDAQKRRRDTILDFSVPPNSRQAELSPGSLGLILTDDDPDLRMDPQQWRSCSVNLLPGSRPDRLRLNVMKHVWNGPTMRRLIRDTPAAGWYLDQAHVDVNTDRMADLLRYLGGEQP